MSAASRVLRGVAPSEPVMDDCVLFSFKYIDAASIEHEHVAFVALYDVETVEGEAVRVGRVLMTDLLLALPVAWGQSPLIFAITSTMFITQLFFVRKSTQQLSGQLFCCGQAYSCTVTAIVKEKGTVLHYDTS